MSSVHDKIPDCASNSLWYLMLQTQYSSFNNPNSGGGPNQFLSSLSFYTNTASGTLTSYSGSKNIQLSTV